MLECTQCSSVLQAAKPPQVEMSPEPDIVVELEKENLGYGLPADPTLPPVFHLQPSSPSSSQGEQFLTWLQLRFLALLDVPHLRAICGIMPWHWAAHSDVHGQEHVYNSAQDQVQGRGTQGCSWMLQRITLHSQSSQWHRTLR